ncbi:MAG TPA: TadE/TadG family type IV pilus assembly protein [Bryobacteraceae bacterium]|nr:TadE/TadG family type IV pilus assembly protein [Bryobacteraceae bacterium]
MRIAIRPGKDGRRGSVILEFAVASTVLMLMTFGVIDFARVFYTANVVDSAARAGTQYGMQSQAHIDFSGMQTAAYNDAGYAAGNSAGFSATATQFCTCSIGGASVDCNSSCGSSALEKYIQVSTSMPFSTLLSIPGLPQTINQTATSTIRVQ